MTEELEKQKSEIKQLIDERLEKATAQARENSKGEIETVVKSELTNLSDKWDAIAKSVENMELSLKRQNEMAREKSMTFEGAVFEKLQKEEENLKEIAHKKGRRFQRFEIEGIGEQDWIRAKAVGNVTLSNVTGALPTQLAGNFVTPNVRKVHIRSIVRSSPLTAATYSYPILTDKEGTVGIQTEGAAKSKTDQNIEFALKSPVVIAHIQTYSNQILEDIPRLQSYITNNMVEMLLKKEDAEILTGAGGSNRLAGILTGATAYAPTGTANTSNAGRFNYLINAISQLSESDYTPNGILVNPYVYYELLMNKTTAKEYTMPYNGVIFVGDTLFIAGIPVYQSTAQARNSFTVGDWSQAELLVKNGITIETSTENNDNFDKNLVSIRVEERIGLVVEKPAAFITGSFTALAS